MRVPVLRALATVGFLLSVMPIGGCGDKSDQRALARVDARTITMQEYEDHFTRQPRNLELTVSEQRLEFLDSLVHKELLVLGARERGLFEDSGVVSKHTRFIEDYLRSEFEARHVAIDSTVTDADLKSAFEMSLTEYRLRHMAHWSQTVADSARRRIDAGEDFAAVAIELSIDPRVKENDGLLDWMSVHVLSDLFREQISGLDIGETAGPFESPFGFHLLRLEEMRTREEADFAAERTRLQEQIMGGRRRDAGLAMQAMLRERYHFEIDADATVETAFAARAVLAPERDPDSPDQAPPAAVTAAGWEPDEEQLARVLATYDDGQITVADYRTFLLGRGPAIAGRLNPGAAIQDVKRVFYDEAILREARRTGIDGETEAVERFALKLEEIAVTELYRSAIIDSLNVSDEDVRAYYEANRELFIQPERVRYAFIEVDDGSIAEALTLEMQDSPNWTKFDSLRTDLYQRGHLINAKRDTGYQPVDEAPPALVEAVREMENMQAAHVMTEQGTHLAFVLIQREDEHQQSFDEAKNTAIGSARSVRSEELLHALLEDLQSRYTVETHPELLDETGG